MKNIEELKTELEELNDAKTAVHVAISKKKSELCEICPVKIGDTVECNGYSYNGKKIIVGAIFYEERNMYRLKTETMFKCVGRIIKKDGSDGVARGEHFC